VVCAYIIFAQWLLFLPIAHIIIFARHFCRLIVCGNQGKSTAGGEGHQTAVEWVAGRALNHSIAAQDGPFAQLPLTLQISQPSQS